jgi:predicted dehydrogenase
MDKKNQCAIIGCGGMARHHIRNMLKQADTTEISVVCEPSEEMYKKAAALFDEAGLAPPPNQPDLFDLLDQYGHSLHAAFIITPHVFHFEQTAACLQAGLDVLLEKPMVMNAAEAEELINIQEKTKRLLVVAFPGSLSPQIRTAVKMLQAGELGDIISISATVWQNWGPGTMHTWRQDLKKSGGGFLFDTGAHMLNTVVDLAGEEFSEVAAWLDNMHRPVETVGVVIGKLTSGAMVTLHGCGETIRSCASEISVFCSKAILRTGIWGERLELQKEGENSSSLVAVPPSLGVWDQFMAVRAQLMPNPCPPVVGLRMARLYDAIKESASLNGAPVRIGAK